MESTGHGELGLVFMVAGLVAFFAPVVLAVVGQQGAGILVSLTLVASAGVSFVLQPNVFGQLFSAVVWLGAMVAGGCSLIAGVVEAESRRMRKAVKDVQQKPGPPTLR